MVNSLVVHIESMAYPLKRMKKRVAIPHKIVVEVLVANGHTCCICKEPGGSVQIHHIDGNPRNNKPENLAVLCLLHHSRVTGDEGLGRRFSKDEVRKYKVLWEDQISESRRERQKSDAIMKTSLAKHPNWFGPRSRFQLTTRDGHHRELEFLNKKLMPLAVRSAGLSKMNIQSVNDEGLELLVRSLRERDLLSFHRPNNHKEAKVHPFVFEQSCVATKVLFFPGFLKKSVPSLKELAIWVSSPTAATGGHDASNAWNFDGTFLYIVESFWQEDTELATVFSGCSALQALSNVVTGQPFFKRDSNEALGRRSFLHPVEKLKGLGGIVMDERTIEVLYKTRYMTDEQCFVDDEKAYRVHDLLAYPVFVCLRW